MRSPNEPQWIPSERMAAGHRPTSPSSSFARGTDTKPDPPTSENTKREPPMSVRVRNTAPPDPELLSKIGCRCLVIDFPGVLYENISVSYADGFVRVEGKRTVGKKKSFRKRFPINHDQVVTRMLSAFLCQGVLVIVAPTKVAAAMAAAAIVAAQLLAKGYSFTKTFLPGKRLLRLTQYATTIPEEGPVKFSTNVRQTTVTSPIGVSAFEPYVAKKAIPFDITAKSIPFDEAAAERSSRVTAWTGALQDKHGRKANNTHDAPVRSPQNAGVQKPEVWINGRQRKTRKGELDDPVQEPEIWADASPGSTAVESYSSSEGIQETEKQTSASQESKGLESTSSSELSPAVWSDDSLRDEPSVNATKSLRIMEGIYIDSIRESRNLDAPQLSPILEHPYSDNSFSMESPDTSQSSDRPLAWVQFDSAWQEKEESLMVDTAANHRRIERLHETGRRKAEGTNVRVGVPIMLPFEDELMDREDDHGLRVELEPNPYWRSAPFLPRLSNSNSPHHLDTIDHYSIDARGPALAHRESNQLREQRKPPSPSLRRKDKSTPTSPTTASGRRKSVTWVDEI